MSTVKEVLENAHSQLGELETTLRDNLQNKNIADIIGNARAKLAQAATHPDAETELHSLEKHREFPFGGGNPTDPNAPTDGA